MTKPLHELVADMKDFYESEIAGLRAEVERLRKEVAAAWLAVPESADRTRGIFYAIHGVIDRLIVERDTAKAEAKRLRDVLIAIRWRGDRCAYCGSEQGAPHRTDAPYICAIPAALKEERGGGQAVRFRKKPVVIEAIQFRSPASVGEVLDFCKGYADYDHILARPVIRTLEGDHLCSPGDWIIKGVKGEFYPCKPDIFAATYETVPEERGEGCPECGGTGRKNGTAYLVDCGACGGTGRKGEEP